MDNLKRVWWILGAALAIVSVAGCGDDGGTSPTDAAVDVRRPPIVSTAWETEVVATGNMGLFIRVAAGRGPTGLAYFASRSRNGGPCTEVGATPPDKLLWDLHYAELSGTSWNIEDIAAVLVVSEPPGLDLALAPDGTPTVAALTGEPWVTPGIGYCGANDLGLYRRDAPGSWSVDVAVASSGEAATGMPASDYGEVVGYWPGLAYDSSGNAAIAYRDVHAGGIQSDDLRRADLEMAWGSGGGWRHIAVDPGRSAGEHNRLVFDGDGRPVIAYYLPMEGTSTSQQGLWVARSDDAGGSWDQVRLLAGPTSRGPDVVIDSSDVIHVIYYDGNRGVPVHARLSDPMAFTNGMAWDQQIFGDPRYDEGHEPSVAIDPSGLLAVAYYRCVRATEGLGSCRSADDALVFGFFERGAWELEVVNDGDDGQCGLHPSLGFESGGAAVIGYECQALVGGSLDDQVHLARRDPL